MADEVRVFTERLERAAAKRRPHDVDGRAEQDVVALVLRLVADDRTGEVGHLRVKARRDSHRDRQRRGEALLDSLGVIGEVGRAQPDTRDRGRLTGVTAGDTGQEADLLGLGQSVQHQVSALVRRQAGVAPRPLRDVAARPRGPGRRAMCRGSYG